MLQLLDFILYFVQFFFFSAVFWLLLSVKYNTLLDVLYYFIVRRIHLKTSEQMSKFFLAQLHIGQDWGFSRKSRRILMRLGWLDSLL